MINLRKTKYIVITDGVTDTTAANVIACDDIYEAQQVFKKAIDDCLEPVMMESAKYIEDSMGDRYAEYEASEELEQKLKAKKSSKELLRRIVSRNI